MGFSQLYYTSCERGLSGHPGYQFNAATPGVRPDVMAEVASMTAYKPPPTLAYDVDPAVLAAAPVNLCYRPGSTTVLAQVAFVGTDYSRRFGNYFAHALVTENPADFGQALPIELWGSALWTRSEADDVALPVLGGLVPGTLDRHEAMEFVAGHPGARHLPALLTAIDLAVRKQERKVVLVEKDADAVARWIAAASYLLPPETARQMSFSTYEHEPRQSRMNVVGTLAESDVDRNGFETYHLFDLVADEISEIPVHPLAQFLVDMGVESAEELWRRAGELGDGSEHGLDDWHPVVLADNGTDREGMVVVAPWLAAHARRLGAPTVDRIGALLDVEGCPADVLAPLAEAVGAVGARGFAENVELAWARAFVAGSPTGSALSLRSASARDYAAVALAERLPVSSPDTAAALLSWASTCGIRVSGDVQFQTGLRAFGPAVFDESARLLPLLRNWPDLRAGVVAHLSTVVRTDLSKVVDLLSSELAPALGLREAPGLTTAVLVADAAAGRIPPSRALARIADSGVVPPEVLTRLWPNGWTHHDALLLLENVEKRLFCESPLLEWLDSALLLPPSETGGETYDRLCAKVREEPVMDVLPRDTVKQITTRFETAALVDRMAKAQSAGQFDQRMKEFIFAFHRVRSGSRKAEMLSMVLDRIGEFRLEWFALLYVALGALRKAYWDEADQSLNGRRPDPGIAADLLTLAWHLKSIGSVHGAKSAHKALQDNTLRSVEKWRRSDVLRTAEVLRRRGPADLADWFGEQSSTYAGSAIARFVLKQMRKRGAKP
ncbi:GTPase-associated protein 1-related protein [Lentzea nigeriaca]|uniref:GTPase-associated protein 1-related protein n=1 Tax=Lentzea nigeriaca TaxID=1128665 RepID=UPI00195B1812|nr:GTPase-associated protein 1-related protein [Lentzea nigeriaca]MBM7863440.1 hypothetical protein [Lentzea nigeriaca]